MRILSDILYNVNIQAMHGSTDITVNALSIDSRAIGKGDAFIAIRGVHADGHLFIDKALQQGAAVVICEELPQQLAADVCYVQVVNSAIAVGTIAGNFYENPSQKVQLVGVTGTNGKTTIATLLFRLFTELGFHCGLLSTVQNQIGEKIVPATHTTPDAIHLNALLADMVAEGVCMCLWR
jgi:UDP-N-acetylmuramoyl-L-alanyl-D-glutamate--2,6-diaminopimelate ligase